MQITYQLTQRDFREAIEAHWNRSILSKWFHRLAKVLVILALLTGLAAAALPSLHPFLRNYVPLLVAAVFASGLIWGLSRWMARSQFTKQPSAQGPITMLADPTGIHLKYSGGTADVEWQSFIQFLEAENHLLLYLSPVSFEIVPKRSLSPEQIAEFRGLIEQYGSRIRSIA